MKYPNLLRPFVLGCLLTVGLAVSARAQGTVVLLFGIPSEPPIQAGGPVYLDLTLQNSSSDTIRVNMGQHGKWNYEFSLINPDRTKTPIPPYRQLGPGPRGTITLEPGQTRTRRLLFNEWYTFLRPGDYILKVRLTVLLSSSANVSWQKEFFEDLQVKVAPRNPESLREICAQLAEAAANPNSSEPAAAIDASFALSFITDPVAVPSLARVLNEGPAAARSNAIRGLARVGSREAREALQSTLATADPELRAKIESALSQFPPGS
jgi:hypothetical protein